MFLESAYNNLFFPPIFWKSIIWYLYINSNCYFYYDYQDKVYFNKKEQ